MLRKASPPPPTPSRNQALSTRTPKYNLGPASSARTSPVPLQTPSAATSVASGTLATTFGRFSGAPRSRRHSSISISATYGRRASRSLGPRRVTTTCHPRPLWETPTATPRIRARSSATSRAASRPSARFPHSLH
eukprot:789665-Pyramimonas_sp.AAC.1